MGDRAVKRGGPITRYTRLRTKTPLKKVNRARKAKLHERNFGDYADTIRAMPCCICDRYGVQASHVKARGMGGCNSDKSSLVPMCARCHRLYHVMGPDSFQARFQVDLEAEAETLWHLYGEGAEG